jgi:HEAT repeat protein
MQNVARHAVTSPKEHVLTVQEALEPLFLALEEEAEVKMIAAAVKAGWPVEEAVAAIDELRRNELLPLGRSH